ncbi:hypothetical protein ACHAXR_013314 [Thalassiosira sp. AJA248-18]
MEAEEEELRDLLDERDRYIDQLEAELSAQDEDNEKQRGESDRYIAELEEDNDKLQVLVKQHRGDNEDLGGEIEQLKDQVKFHKSQLDAQKGILALASKSSEDAKRLQKDGNQQLHRLELENQRLRATIVEIEEDQDILVSEIDTLVNEKSTFQSKSEELTSKCDALYADLDEKARIHSQLVHEKEKAQSEQAAYATDIKELQRKYDASRSEITRLLLELEQERDKNKESACVKENEAFRIELKNVRKENKKLHSLYDQCLRDKNQAERDLDSAIRALNESKQSAREQVALAARKERMALTESTAKVDAAAAKLDAELQRCRDAEEQLDDLRSQLEQSEARNSSYEKNHGLTEAIRCQKQLEADIRRRDYDLKKLNHTLGVELDKRRLLSKACDLLKEKANLGPDFKFDDEEMQSALKNEDNRLQCENIELSRQLETLEGERTKLLAQLRERAVDIGDKGLRFLGMNSHQVAQVMEFASNIRRGIAELPLNDRSKELLSEISRLKSDREVDRVTIERLEREIFSLSETDTEPRGEGLILQQVVNDLTNENQKLRDEIDALKMGGSLNGSALTPMMRDRAKEWLGEDLVQTMHPAAEMQFVLLMNHHEKATQELTMLKNNASKQWTEVADGHTCALESDRSGKSSGGILDSCVSVVDMSAGNERKEKLTDTVASLEKAMKELRNERDAVIAQLDQLVDGNDAGLMGAIAKVPTLTAKCKDLENDLTNEQNARIAKLDHLAGASTNEKENAMFATAEPQNECTKVLFEGAGAHCQTHAELKYTNDSLRLTQKMLSGYSNDVAKLRGTIFAMQESRIDSAKVAMQMSCLNDIIREKNRIIHLGKEKLAAVKQLNLKLSREHRVYNEPKSDRSISTHSIDRSILRAASNSGNISPTRNHIQKHLEEATKLVFEKETVIEEHHQTILELKEKLALADESSEQLKRESESMKTDISTLVSRLDEADAAVNGLDAYHQKCDEVQDILDSKKKEVNVLRGKLSVLAKEVSEKDAKIKEAQDSVVRTKRVLSVTRQGKARSEQNLKVSNEEVTSLKDQLEKIGTQMNQMKKEKIDAQNAKLKLSRKARISATKLKDLTDEYNRKESSKTVEELEKRVNVLNKTVSGLASQNSKLRGELAAHKLGKKKADEEAMAVRQTLSRERPTSSRAKPLEDQVKTLQKSLAQEKKNASDSSSMLDRYQKRIHAMEKALQSVTGGNDELKGSKEESVGSNAIEALQKQLTSLANDNKSLRLAAKKTDDNIHAQVKQLKVENDALKKENERLSQVGAYVLFPKTSIFMV